MYGYYSFKTILHTVVPLYRGFYCVIHREVLAGRSVLNMPDRVDWKACSVSKEEETKLATSFRENFEPFDFTADL